MKPTAKPSPSHHSTSAPVSVPAPVPAHGSDAALMPESPTDPAALSPIGAALHRITERIRGAEIAARRPAGSVTLLAVSKTFGVDAIRAAARAGQRAFGENYLQEAMDKIATLQPASSQATSADAALEWHFIGPLQSNKTRPIAEAFDWVHSVEREKIARRLAEQRPLTLAPLQICIQVNVSGEASKSGCTPQEAPALALAIIQYPSLSLRGVMAIPAASDDPVAQRAAFARARGVYETIKVALQQQAVATPLGPAARALPRFDTLSMGMSADLEAAIAEGATLVRVGSAIFGDRSD